MAIEKTIIHKGKKRGLSSPHIKRPDIPVIRQGV
jgi:hypothetical protein